MRVCNSIAILILMVCCMIVSCSKPINTIEATTPAKEDKILCPNGVTATLKNLTGLDGCSWVLVLENGKKLEPINLKKFDHIKLEDGKQVIVEYETKPLAASICMVGTIVEIICISEK
jgi:hypothetical protein